MIDDLPAARLLLLAGRSPDEQYALLKALGFLASRALNDRMAVVLLLDRQYQAHVAEGNLPLTPQVSAGADLADLWRRSSSRPVSEESPYERLARWQVRALAESDYLDLAGCRVADVEAWWTGVVPLVSEVHDRHNRIFAAIAPPDGQPSESDGGEPGPRVFPFVVRSPRTDPITCPLCGRPTPRKGSYCVWCGRWLAARPR